MRLFFGVIFAVFLPGIVLAQRSPGGTAAAQSEDIEFVDRLARQIKRVTRECLPTVVHIEAEKEERTAGRTQGVEEAGAGILLEISKSLVIVTNRHVIHGAPYHRVRLQLSDGRSFHPTKVVDDQRTDVAVMFVDGTGLPTAIVGDSSRVEIGEMVLAIGSPFGLSHSASFGIISAVGRRSLTLGDKEIPIQDFFQTDAAINPGNSGGPLFNLRGEVIGLNTAIASNGGGSEGIGFAIPMNIVLRVAKQLVERGRFQHAFLGVTLDPDFDAADARVLGLTKYTGARVKKIEANSPASLAGFQVNDIILSFDGTLVQDDDHLVAIVGLTDVDRTIPIVVYRQGKQFQINVTLTSQ
jgi:serine protease Do